MRMVLMAIFFALTSGLTAAHAERLDAPAGRVILEVKGNTDNRNTPDAARFDLAMLDAMPQKEIKTVTPWTDGLTVFTGVSLSYLLDAVGAADDAETISAVALNDYKVEIPVSDARLQGVIIASRMNGETMSVREKGPLWVIYPISDKPEIDSQETYSKMIWQLKRLEVN